MESRAARLLCFSTCLVVLSLGKGIEVKVESVTVDEMEKCEAFAYNGNRLVG